MTITEAIALVAVAASLSSALFPWINAKRQSAKRAALLQDLEVLKALADVPELSDQRSVLLVETQDDFEIAYPPRPSSKWRRRWLNVWIVFAPAALAYGVTMGVLAIIRWSWTSAGLSAFIVPMYIWITIDVLRKYRSSKAADWERRQSRSRELSQ